MTTFTEFCERIGERVGVDSSYLTSDIPSSVHRYMRKLLRDYNFPKSVAVEVYDLLDEGQQSYELPSDCKKVLQVMFRDLDSDGETFLYTDPLRKREGFTRATSDGIARYYWQEGLVLKTDILIPASAGDDLVLVLAYQSNDPIANADWLLDDFEDTIFSLTMARLSAELGKPELADVWGPLWKEDQRGLAIYTNELEFGNLDMVMRSAEDLRYQERYPIA